MKSVKLSVSGIHNVVDDNDYTNNWTINADKIYLPVLCYYFLGPWQTHYVWKLRMTFEINIYFSYIYIYVNTKHAEITKHMRISTLTW